MEKYNSYLRGLAKLTENMNHVGRVMEICWIFLLGTKRGGIAADMRYVGLEFSTRNRIL
jgi:hypothetical protein